MRHCTRITLLFVAALSIALPVLAQSRDDCREMVLHNGKIATMDARGTTATSVTIRDDRIVAVGTGRGIPPHSSCATVIDLRGRAVLPGLIDSHDHIVQLTLRPGHDMRTIETTASIANVQQAIRAKAATVPAGQWITAIGGWSQNQLAEKRLPTLAELDQVAPKHPVYLHVGFAGPAATNSAGKAFFESKSVAVGPDGSIGANAPATAALVALRSLQTFEDKKRGARDAMAYVAGLGLTTHMDKGGGWPPDTEGAKGLAQLGNGGAGEVNPFTGFDQLFALHREGPLPVRVRIFFYMQDITPAVPFVRQRVNNAFFDFGSDYLKVSGFGERIHGPSAPPGVYEAAIRVAAEHGWAHDQHTGNLEEEKAFVDIWERVNATTPLASLRWCLAHVPGIDVPTLNRLKALGVGISSTGGRYLNGTAAQPGAQFRLLMDSGLPLGHGSDGGSVAPINPWPHIYFMVTGKNSAGELIEPGQTLTRMEALRMYTTGNAWFSREEQTLGSIEPGKLADLFALSEDFLDPARVPDEAIKRITSVLTVVGGRIVHDAGVLATPRPRPAGNPATR
jgi:predicted amidohydrolase YtcJ